MSGTKTQMMGQSGQIRHVIGDAVRTGRPLGSAVAPPVIGHDTVAMRQRRYDGVPVAMIKPGPMDKDKRRSPFSPVSDQCSRMPFIVVLGMRRFSSHHRVGSSRLRICASQSSLCCSCAEQRRAMSGLGQGLPSRPPHPGPSSGVRRSLDSCHRLDRATEMTHAVTLYCISMFQNTVTGACITPTTLLRIRAR